MDVIKEFEKILAQVAGVPADAVKPETKYRVDLGLDSVDLVETLIEIERIFDVQISEEEAEALTTVGELIAVVEQKMEDQPKAATG